MGSETLKITPERIERFKYLKAKRFVLFRHAENELADVRYALIKQNITNRPVREGIEKTIDAYRNDLHAKIALVSSELMAICAACPDVAKLCGGLDMPECIRNEEGY